MTKRPILRVVLLMAATMCVASELARAQRRGPPPQGMMGPSHLMGPHDMGSHGHMEMFHPVPRILTYPILSLGGRWWDDKKTVHNLNLRPEQSQRMDSLFESNKDSLQTLLNNLHREEQRFVEMPRGDLRDETKVFAQIDRIAQARAEMEKADFHMLLQIRAQLDPDQLTELDKEIADAIVGQ